MKEYLNLVKYRIRALERIVRQLAMEEAEDRRKDTCFFMDLGLSLASEGDLLRAERAFLCAAETARQTHSVGDDLQCVSRKRFYRTVARFLKREALKKRTEALVNADRLGSSRELAT